MSSSSHFSYGLIIGIWSVILIATSLNVIEKLNEKDVDHYVFNSKRLHTFIVQGEQTKIPAINKYTMLTRLPNQ